MIAWGKRIHIRSALDGSRFDINDLPGESRRKTALPLAPPVYDTQYWSQWSQPYGLLRIASPLKKHRHKRIDCSTSRRSTKDNASIGMGSASASPTQKGTNPRGRSGPGKPPEGPTVRADGVIGASLTLHIGQVVIDEHLQFRVAHSPLREPLASHDSCLLGVSPLSGIAGRCLG